MMSTIRKLNIDSAYGFKVLLAGEEAVRNGISNDDHFTDEGHVLYFESFGNSTRGFYFNDVWIEPASIKISNGGRMYSFRQQVGAKWVSGWFEFVGVTGYGHISFDQNGGYAVRLHPWAVTFDVEISMNAGAYYSTSEHRLVWNKDSDAWKTAKWIPDQMQFAYDVYEELDPILGTVEVIECRFTDIGDPTFIPPHYMELSANQGYTATMSSGNLFSLSVQSPPDEKSREHETVRSVYPKGTNFQFDQLGLNFVGAYQDKYGNVYAVKGKGQELLAGSYQLGGIANSRVSVYGGQLYVDDIAAADCHQAGNRLYWDGLDHPAAEIPISGYIDINQDQAMINDKHTGARVKAQRLHAVELPVQVNVANNAKLDITGLMGMNPMQMDKDGRYYDVVGRNSMDDFYKILVNYMDTDLRQNFVSGSQPDMSPEVRSIAFDHNNNATFYKTLQVPYLAKALSNSTLDQAQYLNGSRASQQLKRGTANNEVYKRHSDALYRMHWLKLWGNMQDYLNDQEKNDHSTQIDNIFTSLKDHVTKQMEGAVDTDKKSRLNDILKEMDELKQWTKKKKVYWACMLYYYLTKYWMPTLRAKLIDGNLSQDVSQQIKMFSALFNILEGTEGNKDGKSFNQAFMETVRAFQLTAVLPQYVDYGGDPEYFSEVLEGIFAEFMKKYVNTTDPDLINHVNDIRQLLQNRELTSQFVRQMSASLRILGDNATWDKIATTFEIRCSEVFKNIPNVIGKARIVLLGSAMAGFIMVLSAGDFKSLTAEQKAGFIVSSTSVFVNLLAGLSQNVIRVATLWGDFSGVWGGVKVFFGYEKFLSTMPSTTSKLSSGFAKWFVRSRAEVIQMQEAGSFTKLEMAFGRNLNEFLSQTFGAALAIVSIVLSAINLATATDPLAIAMDSLMLAASALQLIATVGNWILVGVGVAEGILVDICFALGPIGVAVAIAGLIVMIVMMARHQDPPDPLKDFVNNQADKSKLKMPYKTEIDYFNVVPNKDGKSYDGIAIKSGSNYLQLKTLGGKAGISPLTNNADTIFFVLTDDQGLTRIFTPLPDDKKNLQTVYLSVNDNGDVSALPAPTPPQLQKDGTYKPTEAEYLKQLARQQWSCVCRGESTVYTQSDDKYLMQANFTLMNKATEKYLNITDTGVLLSQLPNTLTLGMERFGPGKLVYHPAKFSLYTNSTDQKVMPYFDIAGSGPLTWSIKPPLPEGFEMITAGSNAGVVRQKSGVTPPSMNESAYEVTVSNQINGQTFSQSSTIRLKVEIPQALNTILGWT